MRSQSSMATYGFLFIATALAPISASPLPFGDALCPCLLGESLIPLSANATHVLGESHNLTRYGLGCKAHDVGTAPCTPAAPQSDCDEIFPRPPSCDRQWCDKEWCFVDATNCRLAHEPSYFFPWSNQHYSYATCDNMDRFVNEERVNLLRNKTFRVGFNSNTGGWKGAYSPFGDFSKKGWEGPIVDFMNRAAFEGNFNMQRSAPPDRLTQQAEDFFSSSLFDRCVYATSLGYLDFCTALYWISNERVAAATFFTMFSEPMYLATFEDDGGSWSSFWSNVGNVFKPFTPQTWMLTMFGVIPIMSLLISFHEYKSKDSYNGTAKKFSGALNGRERCRHYQDASIADRETRCPPDENFHDCNDDFLDIIDPTSDTESSVTTADMKNSPPKCGHEEKAIRKIGGSLFRGYNAFFQQAYQREGKSVGGRITVLGIGFFILTTVASYTANLAAILTENARTSRIESIEDAIKANFNFCGDRKNAEPIMKSYRISDRFVPDPEDGKPGFNCGRCKSRTRAIDFLKRDHSDESLYCNAAIVMLEDLEQLHAQGLHCNKTVIGLPLGFIDVGIPIFDGIAEEMVTFLQGLKNRGEYQNTLKHTQPASQCPDASDEGSMSLSIIQLSGVWVITFFFAMAGLAVKVMELCFGLKGSCQRVST